VDEDDVGSGSSDRSPSWKLERWEKRHVIGIHRERLWLVGEMRALACHRLPYQEQICEAETRT
jgi:hypothetical protein